VTRYLIDTNVFVYARGTDHPYRMPCRTILRSARDGALTLEASVEVVQEFAHLLLRRGVDRVAALEEVAEVRAQCRLHAFDVDVLNEVTRLLAEQPTLGVRDAVHAATAVQAGIPAIITTDRVFDRLRGLTRLDPIADRDQLQRPM
jgi:predicted nucleic acid-binding protein